MPTQDPETINLHTASACIQYLQGMNLFQKTLPLFIKQEYSQVLQVIAELFDAESLVGFAQDYPDEAFTLIKFHAKTLINILSIDDLIQLSHCERNVNLTIGPSSFHRTTVRYLQNTNLASVLLRNAFSANSTINKRFKTADQLIQLARNCHDEVRDLIKTADFPATQLFTNAKDIIKFVESHPQLARILLQHHPSLVKQFTSAEELIICARVNPIIFNYLLGKLSSSNVAPVKTDKSCLVDCKHIVSLFRNFEDYFRFCKETKHIPSLENDFDKNILLWLFSTNEADISIEVLENLKRAYLNPLSGGLDTKLLKTENPELLNLYIHRIKNAVDRDAPRLGSGLIIGFRWQLQHIKKENARHANTEKFIELDHILEQNQVPSLFVNCRSFFATSGDSRINEPGAVPQEVLHKSATDPSDLTAKPQPAL